MTNLFAGVNHNSQDVEEGQLPPDKHPEPVIPPYTTPASHAGRCLLPSPFLTQAPAHASHPHNPPEQDSSSGQIVLEVVDDQFYSKRRAKKTDKPPERPKNFSLQREREREKERGGHDRSERERKADKNRKRGNLAPEREDPSAAEHRIKSNAYQQPYYPPYMYPPPIPMQVGQYPLYSPYSYPQNYPQTYPSPNTPPQPPSQYSQYPQRTIPQQTFPETANDRPSDNPYKAPPPPPIYNYPGYPLGYPPYDYYERQRQAQQREEQQRASRKREYMDELRNQLRRNVKDFNNDESLQILEAVKCILKFQDHRPPNSQSPSSNITEAPPQHHDPIAESMAQRAYERSLQRVEKWLEGENPNIRQFMKGLLEAMQMSEVILKIKELKLSRKMQQESLQSETKRLLDVLVRDPKKMIF